MLRLQETYKAKDCGNMLGNLLDYSKVLAASPCPPTLPPPHQTSTKSGVFEVVTTAREPLAQVLMQREDMSNNEEERVLEKQAEDEEERMKRSRSRHAYGISSLDTHSVGKHPVSLTIDTIATPGDMERQPT